MNLLWIIPFTTYKEIPAAGGQLLYHYYSYLKEQSDIDISYIGLSYSDADFSRMQESFADATDFSYINKRRGLIEKGLDYFDFKIITPLAKYVSPSFFYTNFVVKQRLKQSLKNCMRSNYTPDVILLEFSHSGVLIDIVKDFFPNSKFITTAHDLFYINIGRKFRSHVLNDFYSKTARKFEMGKFKKYDTVITYNYKDLDTLKNEGVNALYLSPFYQTWTTSTEQLKNGILFWGALYRPENYNGVFWFLDNVWEKLRAKYHDLNFYIVGGGLSQINKSKIESYPGVVLTGYVEDPSIYFDRSFCTVVPLFQGAGIKIKVLEAMSSGLPVVTTSVGAEGITAVNGKDCLIAEDAEEFYVASDSIIQDRSIATQLINNAYDLLQKKFDIGNSYQVFTELIKNYK